jgi:hypothetical protein
MTLRAGHCCCVIFLMQISYGMRLSYKLRFEILEIFHGSMALPIVRLRTSGFERLLSRVVSVKNVLREYVKYRKITRGE